jgi:hypothetical protein
MITFVIHYGQSLKLLSSRELVYFVLWFLLDQLSQSVLAKCDGGC